MPQPINRIVRDPYVILNTDALSSKPDFAILVCEIFAVWASIERDLSNLMVRLLGADAAPSHAIFSILQTQSLQTKALEAAAKSTLDTSSFEAFTAFMVVIASVQKARNRLAHWAWGTCKQRPDLFVLADPKMLKERDARTYAHFQSQKPGIFDLEETWNALQFDDSSIYGYTKDDLERELRDLKQADHIATIFGMFLDPSVGIVHSKALDLTDSPKELRRQLFGQLEEQPLFRSALAQTRANQKSTRPPPDGSSPPASGE